MCSTARVRPLAVDPGVFEEPVILTCEKHLHQSLRDFVEAQRRAALLAEFGEKLVVAGIDPRRNLQPHDAEESPRKEAWAPDTSRYPRHRNAAATTASQHEDAKSLECAGESNHCPCSTRTRGRPIVNRAPPWGSTVSVGSMRRWFGVDDDWGKW